MERVGATHFDATEDLKVHLVDKAEVLEMLKAGAFMQVMMAAPLWKFFYDLK